MRGVISNTRPPSKKGVYYFFGPANSGSESQREKLTFVEKNCKKMKIKINSSYTLHKSKNHPLSLYMFQVYGTLHHPTPKDYRDF